MKQRKVRTRTEHNGSAAPTRSECAVTVQMDITAAGRRHLIDAGLLRIELIDDAAAVGLALLDAAAAHLGLHAKRDDGYNPDAPPVKALARRPQPGMGGYADLSGRVTDIRRALRPRNAVLADEADRWAAHQSSGEAIGDAAPIGGNMTGLARDRFGPTQRGGGSND